MWKLQENIFSKKDLNKYASYLKSSKRLTQGKEVESFEKKFSKWNGSKYSIFVNSGSSANLLIIFTAKEFFNWKDGDEIIVPSLTWPTTVTPIIQAGLKPVFIDTNLNDLSVKYDQIKKKITKKTKAIFLAHILGFPADINKIKKALSNRKIKIFEDCCESIGAKFNNKKIGNFGDAGSFSFYWGHHISTIEGGMICTNNKKFYHLCRMKRSHGFAKELPPKKFNNIRKKYKNFDSNFLFLTDGFNLRSTNFNAFIGIQQLKKLNHYIKARNYNYKLFLNETIKYKDYVHTIIPKKIKSISSFAFPILFKKTKYKENFKKKCKLNNIEYRPIISGNLLKQPLFKNKFKNNFFVSNKIHNFGIYLGNNQFVKINKIKTLSKIFNSIFLSDKKK